MANPQGLTAVTMPATNAKPKGARNWMFPRKEPDLPDRTSTSPVHTARGVLLPREEGTHDRDGHR